MDAIRIRRRLDATTLHAPELEPFVGRRVEIIVLDDESQPPHRIVTRGLMATAGTPTGDPVAEVLAELRLERAQHLGETSGDIES